MAVTLLGLSFDSANMDQLLCQLITIVDDDVPEYKENFCVELSTTDPDVILDPQQTVVSICDDDGMCIVCCDCKHVIHEYIHVHILPCTCQCYLI